ncbi:hypothetical protein BB559_005396 [Furculomyces boomerangus]|uniref:Uncharacterized protein n=2 Tax=Harpellales TaxID=61421 RepID=A0A2T9Y8X6_9FUNG|nr:hypothetical protein BB559_005396 [Furculomyces boomerangus]PVZ98793.1 hypothetical protein BB558_005203 [Smittium angustum]
MVLKVSNPNNVKVYTVSGSNLSRKIPDWLARLKKRALKKDREWQTRIELIQDFQFPEAANKIKNTPDGMYCMATGVYKPQIRVFEFAEMSMKFERHTDAENINFLILSDDWTKTVHLQNDRSIEFHTSGSMHYKTRIPKFGRDLVYNALNCDLLVGGASNEVFRLNLDQGRFLKPFEIESSNGVNVCAINPAHQLFGFGTESGTVEFWDPRNKTRIGLLSPTIDGQQAGFEISALKYRDDGLGIALGTSTGQTMIFDLRLSHSLLTKDQQYGLPIKSLHWIEPNIVNSGDGEAVRVLSADSKSIKVWNSLNGNQHCTIEPPADINDVCIYKDTGLIFAACEASEINGYFVPSLGPAPRWANFLENITEELEESTQVSVYEDYKFVTTHDLESIGLEHLVGSNLLKPYMHGFFIDLRLYERAKAVANPFAYDEYRSNQIQNKIHKQRESRIRTAANLPKINKKLAMRLLDDKGTQNEEENETNDEFGTTDTKKLSKSKEKAKMADNLLKDSRFAELFANPEFEVDEESTEYKLLHPTESLKKLRKEAKQAKFSSRAEDDSSEEEY